MWPESLGICRKEIVVYTLRIGDNSHKRAHALAHLTPSATSATHPLSEANLLSSPQAWLSIIFQRLDHLGDNGTKKWHYGLLITSVSSARALIDLDVISWPPDVSVPQWLVRCTLDMNVCPAEGGNPILMVLPHWLIGKSDKGHYRPYVEKGRMCVHVKGEWPGLSYGTASNSLCASSKVLPFSGLSFPSVQGDGGTPFLSNVYLHQLIRVYVPVSGDNAGFRGPMVLKEGWWLVVEGWWIRGVQDMCGGGWGDGDQFRGLLRDIYLGTVTGNSVPLWILEDSLDSLCRSPERQAVGGHWVPTVYLRVTDRDLTFISYFLCG